MLLPNDIPSDRPVVIAGPTAAGKSALALDLAQRQGGTVINADALQVFADWRILTARPGAADLALAPHALYGHVPAEADYSVGHWLRDLRDLLATGIRPIVVGGTGLYLTALTEGLAQIPATPPEIRAEADRRIAADGPAPLLAELDAATRARIDERNPVRVQRAWEVLRATGRGLADWQDAPASPLLARGDAACLLVDVPPDRLAARIASRFDAMLAAGALEEVRANLHRLDPRRPFARAIGSQELARYIEGKLSLDAARQLAVISTRQYAKRQRTWFRARMRDWTVIAAGE